MLPPEIEFTVENNQTKNCVNSCQLHSSPMTLNHFFT